MTLAASASIRTSDASARIRARRLALDKAQLALEDAIRDAHPDLSLRATADAAGMSPKRIRAIRNTNRGIGA
jgi:hypothetical protein